MKRKEILYDEIITEYNGQSFKQGEVRYNKIPQLKSDEAKLLSLHVDLNLAIEEKDSDNFVKELTELVTKYAK